MSHSKLLNECMHTLFVKRLPSMHQTYTIRSNYPGKIERKISHWNKLGAKSSCSSFQNVQMRSFSLCMLLGFGRRSYSSGPMALPAKEFSLKIPGGHIAGKVWNEKAPIAVLCLHGHRDNAGSFDCLVPLLPDHLCCVAIDFPGHGWSSHCPPGTCNTLYHYMIPVERIVRFFGWKQVILLGHSLGGAVGLLYAGTKSSIVNTLILIDLVKPVHRDPKDLPQKTEEFIDTFLLMEKKHLHKSRPTYEYNDLLQYALKGHGGNLDKSQMAVLMKRGAEKMPDGCYAFTHSAFQDSTTGQETFPKITTPSLDQVLGFAARQRARIMILKAKDGRIYEDQKYAHATIEVCRQASPVLEYHVVPGDHHVVLSGPENLAPHIASFLSLGAVPTNNITDGEDSCVSQALLTLS